MKNEAVPKSMGNRRSKRKGNWIREYNFREKIVEKTGKRKERKDGEAKQKERGGKERSGKKL